ncbi:MAG: hypothetical protein AAF940_07140 [Pseudomonadota bacterium]
MSTRLSVKEAVAIAKNYLRELLMEEGLKNLGLEEIEFDDEQDIWLVTLGFSRPWNTTGGPLATLSGEAPAKRAYRVVAVQDSDGHVISVKRAKDLAYA